MGPRMEENIPLSENSVFCDVGGGDLGIWVYFLCSITSVGLSIKFLQPYFLEPEPKVRNGISCVLISFPLPGMLNYLSVLLGQYQCKQTKGVKSLSFSRQKVQWPLDILTIQPRQGSICRYQHGFVSSGCILAATQAADSKNNLMSFRSIICLPSPPNGFKNSRNRWNVFVLCGFVYIEVQLLLYKGRKCVPES